MIDTDKYKGHDTGWKAHFFEDGSIAVGGVCNLLTEETGYVTRKMIEANALLIQDAPLLLEEVKRLREQYTELREALVGDSPNWTHEELIEQALELSKPVELEFGEWHTDEGDDEE